MPMNAMKGPGSRIFLALVDEVEFELLSFVDGSWGIKKGRTLIDIWEPGKMKPALSRSGN